MEKKFNFLYLLENIIQIIFYQMIYQIRGLISIVLFVCETFSLYQITQISTSSSSDVGDFNYGWKIMKITNNGVVLTKNNITGTTKTICSNPAEIYGKINDLTNITRFLVLSYSNIQYLYLYESTSINQKNVIFNDIKAAKFLSDNYFIAIQVSTLIKVNFSSLFRQKSYNSLKYNNDKYMLAGNQTNILVLSQGSYNLTITLLDENLTKINQIQQPVSSTRQVDFRYYQLLNYLIRSTFKEVYIYNSSLSKIKEFNTTQVGGHCGIPSSLFIGGALICNNLLMIVLNNTIAIYEITNWTKVMCYPIINMNILYRINCYNGYPMFGVMYSTGSTNQMKQYQINYTFVINTTNTTTIVNNTTAIVNNTTNISNTINQPIQTIQSQPLDKNIVQDVQLIINSSLIETITRPAFSAIGICLSSPLTINLVKPFLSILTDFWFYGFHFSKYTEFVEIFTTQVDIWNELRIKPQIFNQVVIPENEQQNKLYVNNTHLHERAKKSVYMLLSIQDLYIFGFSICVVQWLINTVFKFLLRILVSQQSDTLKRIYKKLAISTLWWSFLMTVMEPNIAQVTFFGLIQMNSFYSFNPIGKLNLVVTTILIFVVVFYSFAIFLVIMTVNKQKNFRHVFEISKSRSQVQGMMLETSLRGLRSFSQALVHGAFINSNQIQLGGLVLVDLILVVLLLRLHQCFKSRVNLFLNLMYYLALFSFDVMLNLFIRSQAFLLRQISDQMYNYQFASMIIILIIAGLTLSKALFEILKIFVSGVRFLITKLSCIKSSKNKIKNNSKLGTDVNNHQVSKIQNLNIKSTKTPQKQIQRQGVKKLKVTIHDSNKLKQATKTTKLFKLKSKKDVSNNKNMVLKVHVIRKNQ